MSLPTDLWIWSLDRTDAEHATFRSLLTASETARADRFVKSQDGHRFAVGRGRLRQILGLYLDQPPDRIDFDLVHQKKPVIAGGPAFNLSHTGGWAALIVTPDHDALDLGVDIEGIRPFEPGLPKRVFSPAEQRELATLPQSHHQRGFFHGWTRKEAVIKAVGSGLTADLKGFDVSLSPGQPARLTRAAAPLPPAADWALLDLPSKGALCGAVAAVTGGVALAAPAMREGSLPLP